MPSPGPIRLLDASLIFLILNIAALLTCAIVARYWREAGERRRERFRERWEPVLYGRMAGDKSALPRLAPNERLMFLLLWIHVLGYVRDEAANAVVQVARDLGLSIFVLRLLGDRRDWKRVLGMQAAGILRLEEAREVISAKIAPNRPVSSLAAVRALLQIDGQRGLAALQQVLRYPKWSPGAMLAVVKLAGAPATQMLGALVLSALPGRATQIVRLIVLTEDSSALPALRERLEFSLDDKEIAALVHALGRLGGAEDRLTVLKFTAHKSWLVRMQAAFALGAVGTEQDSQRLLPLLHDRIWWVRYRAAQSLLRLEGAAGLGRLRDGESDVYARDMLERVLVEAA